MYQKSDRIALLISVLLHSLLVFFPRQEEPLPSAESSPPTDSISVVELPTLPVSEPPPLPAVPPSPPAPIAPSRPPLPAVPPSPPAPTVPSQPPPTAVPSQPPPTAVPSRPTATAVPPSPPVATPVAPPADLPPDDPISEPSDRPIGQPAPDAGLDADLPPQDPSTETSDSPTEKPESELASETDLLPEDPSIETNDESIDEAIISADWKHWVGYLQSKNEGFESFTLLDVFNLFGEPGQVNQFFDENDQPKIDVSSFYLFPEQTPEQVLQTVVMPELTENTGFELQLQENVSVGLAYQLLQGEMRRHLIIVQLNERSGSVLMLTDSLLGLES